MKSLEDLARTTAAFVPFQKNRDVLRFIGHCIIEGKVDENKNGQFRETFSQSIKQIDRKWTWTTWRICTEKEIENALIEKAWGFLTSKDCLLAHLVSIISTWNRYKKRYGNNKKSQILMDNMLRHGKLISSTDICESCRWILQLKEEVIQNSFSCPTMEQVMFACILVNNMTNVDREDEKLKITRYIITVNLRYSDKFAMAAICKTLFVLNWLWKHGDDKELRRLCDNLAQFLIPNLGSEDIDLIRWLCDRVENVMCRDAGDATLMHMAAKAGNRELFMQLLGRGANVHAVNKDGKTPLHKAAEAGNADVVLWLLDKGAEIEKKSNFGSTVLHKAAENDRKEVIEILLDRGASIKSVNLDGDTPLHVAAKLGKINAIEALLNKGAEIGVRNNAGNTPLLVAGKCSKIEAFQLLLKRSEEFFAVNKIDSKFTEIAFNFCKVNPCLILPLIDSRVLDATAVNGSGETFLHVSAFRGNGKDIQKLIDKGVQVQNPQKTNDTPLHFACRRGNLEAAKCFLNAGVDVSRKNSKERSALHEAVWNSHTEIVELLLAHPELSEQCINAQDHNGKTALHLAVECYQNDRIVRALLRKGADVEIKANDGKSALFLALSKNKPEVIDAFLESS